MTTNSESTMDWATAPWMSPGLPISRALAELHGGTLEIESEPGLGTTVIVRLPSERLR